MMALVWGLLAGGLMVWALCAVAGETDDRAERTFAELAAARGAADRDGGVSAHRTRTNRRREFPVACTHGSTRVDAEPHEPGYWCLVRRCQTCGAVVSSESGGRRSDEEAAA